MLLIGCLDRAKPNDVARRMPWQGQTKWCRLPEVAHQWCKREQVPLKRDIDWKPCVGKPVNHLLAQFFIMLQSQSDSDGNLYPKQGWIVTTQYVGDEGSYYGVHRGFVWVNATMSRLMTEWLPMTSAAGSQLSWQWRRPLFPMFHVLTATSRGTFIENEIGTSNKVIVTVIISYQCVSALDLSDYPWVFKRMPLPPCLSSNRVS